MPKGFIAGVARSGLAERLQQRIRNLTGCDRCCCSEQAAAVEVDLPAAAAAHQTRTSPSKVRRVDSEAGRQLRREASLVLIKLSGGEVRHASVPDPRPELEFQRQRPDAAPWSSCSKG